MNAPSPSPILFGICCYLDDSGSDDSSELVTCGGPVMSRVQAKAFSARWNRILPEYGIDPPLHMTDFVGYGKYAIWYPEMKRALFRDLSARINEHKLYSVSIAVSQTDFKNELGEDIRRTLIGPYAFTFFSIVLANQTCSQKQTSCPFKTNYIIDTGFSHQDQLNEAHAVIVNLEAKKGTFRYTGGFETKSDDSVPALQAADVISWASRRKQLDGTLPEGFEPLNAVLDEDHTAPHRTIEIPRFGIKMLADPITLWISRKGSAPSLEDIIR